MHLHVLAEGRGVGVALVASVEAAVERFVARVDVRVFLPIGAVGEASVAAFELTAEGFLACQRTTCRKRSV